MGLIRNTVESSVGGGTGLAGITRLIVAGKKAFDGKFSKRDVPSVIAGGFLAAIAWKVSRRYMERRQRELGA